MEIPGVRVVVAVAPPVLQSPAAQELQVKERPAERAFQDRDMGLQEEVARVRPDRPIVEAEGVQEAMVCSSVFHGFPHTTVVAEAGLAIWAKLAERVAWAEVRLAKLLALAMPAPMAPVVEAVVVVAVMLAVLVVRVLSSSSIEAVPQQPWGLVEESHQDKRLEMASMAFNPSPKRAMASRFRSSSL